MESLSVTKKPHAVCIPFPGQSHINVMLKLAKVLHFKGFHITFVNTELNHQKVLKSEGPDALKGLSDFQFQTIPDGLPPTEIDATQEISALWDSITQNCKGPLCKLITEVNKASISSGDPTVSCIVADVGLCITLEAAEEFGIPGVLLWPMSPSILMSYIYYDEILEKVLKPLKGDRNDEYLDMPIDLIPGMTNIRLKDLPSYMWDGNDKLNSLCLRDAPKIHKASAIIFNTFDSLEKEILTAIKPLLPQTYTLGPLHLLERQITDSQLSSFKSNLRKEHQDCLTWLDSKRPNSVVYVNFGSTTVMTSKQLVEFAWGLANSKHPFLWVIREDLVAGEAAVLPPEFTEETAVRGMVSGWCPQEEVLCHSSTGGFLTHCGWNSTMDSICGGVPIICWPFIGDQQTNCRYSCAHWGIDMEIDNNVKRDQVERIVGDLMEGKKGKNMKEKAMEWKKSAEVSAKPGGSSYLNLERIVQDMQLLNKKS